MAKKNTKGTLGKIPECKFKKGDNVIHLDTEIKGYIYGMEWGVAEKEWYVSMVDNKDNEYIGKEEDFKKI